jgi:hypothetical protein
MRLSFWPVTVAIEPSACTCRKYGVWDAVTPSRTWSCATAAVAASICASLGLALARA